MAERQLIDVPFRHRTYVRYERDQAATARNLEKATEYEQHVKLSKVWQRIVAPKDPEADPPPAPELEDEILTVPHVVRVRGPLETDERVTGQHGEVWVQAGHYVATDDDGNSFGIHANDLDRGWVEH